MVDATRLREELRRMRALIEAEPAVRARFDTDGNGVIDGDEWEQVRQLVVARLEREEAERAAAAELGAAGGDDDDIPVVVGTVAAGILARDLSQPVPSAAREAGPLTLRERSEVILEETGLASLLGSLVRRNYVLKAADGATIGEIAQRESEFVAGFGKLARPALHFDVIDVTGERMSFRRDPRLLGDAVFVFDARGMQVGHIETKLGVVKPKFRVVSTFDPAPLTVTWPLLHPFTLGILDPFDEPAGEIERGWRGLGGFLTGQNRLHIRVDRDKVPGSLMPSLIACAVLAEMSHDGPHRRASLFDLFNDA